MKTAALYRLCGYEIKELFIKGELSAEKIATDFLARAEKNEQKLSSFICLLKERILNKALELDSKKARGLPLGNLAGIPIAIKDNIHIEGITTSCASKALKNHMACFSASAVLALEKEGALIIGKTNLDELAMGSSTEYSGFYPTKNPWNLQCSPGGSSGGSAASVSARSALLSIGTDTGGSIRQPASLTGILGLKPTYGRISRYGVVPFSSSLDHVGPFATCVKDLALICEVLFKKCPYDPTSLLQAPFKAFDSLETSIEGKIIGVPWNFLKNLEDESYAMFVKAIESLKDCGAIIKEIDCPELKYSVGAYHVIAPLEAFSNLARLTGLKCDHFTKKNLSISDLVSHFRGEGLGLEVKKRLFLGGYLVSEQKKQMQAQQAVFLLNKRFSEIFLYCDAIALPSSPSTAFKLNAHKNPMQGYLQDLYTIGSNLTGHPSLSIPCSLSTEGLPFGLQLIGPRMEEKKLLQMAFQFEKRIKLPLPPLFE